MWLSCLIIMLLIIFLSYIFCVPYPKGWKWTLKLKLLSVLLINVHRFRRFMITVFVSRGYSKANITRTILQAKPLEPLKEVDVFIQEWDGIPVSIYKVHGESMENGRGIVFFHGGGWLTSSFSPLLYSHIAQHANAVVISPQYRKPPEHPFPAAFDDCYAVASRFFRQAVDFGVNPRRIALTGDSAGGNLAAAVSHKLCNDGLSPGRPALQYLLYPVLQVINYNLPSRVENGNDPLLPGDFMDYAKLCYMGFCENERISSAILNGGHLIKNGVIDEDILRNVDQQNLPERFKNYSMPPISLAKALKAREKLSDAECEGIKSLMTNPSLSPLCATNEELRNLPKTFVMTCSADVLRDEGVLYYQRLKKVDVDVNLVHLQKTPHGIFTFTKYAVSMSLDEGFDQINFEYLQTLKENL